MKMPKKISEILVFAVDPFDVQKGDMPDVRVCIKKITATNKKLVNDVSKDLGIGINKDEIIKNVTNKLNENDYWDIYNNYSKDSFSKETFDFKYVIDEEKLISVLEKLKTKVDKDAIGGHLFMNNDRQLIYINDDVGYSLNIEESKEIIKNNFLTNDYSKQISLYILQDQNENDGLQMINTKISAAANTVATRWFNGWCKIY